MTEAAHKPVMLDAVLAAIAPRDGAIYVDGTFGAGGYSRAILDSARCRVCGIDRDPATAPAAAALGRRYADRFLFVAGCYGDMVPLLAARGIDGVDGVALDVGVSSMQLDSAERGFSFAADGPLDMRMSSTGRTAADVVNGEPEQSLARIIRDYGEERRARRVARAIVDARREARIERTGALAGIVRRAVGQAGGAGRDRIDPATRTFQALRIYVNDELGELARGLSAAETLLRPGGRLAVVTFHSLEDRTVKRFLVERSDARPRPSRHAPDADAAARSARFRLLGRRAVRPAPAEVAANPRARSARLRAAERTETPTADGRAG